VEIFSFSPFGVILVTGLSYIAFVMLKYDAFIQNLFWDFVMKEYCVLSSAFFALFLR
jgi:hypothetical protein